MSDDASAHTIEPSLRSDRQVIEPFARGDAAHCQRHDWPSDTLAERHTIEPAPIVVIEGVSTGRSEWAAHLSILIWIETPREERLPGTQPVERSRTDRQASSRGTNLPSLQSGRA